MQFKDKMSLYNLDQDFMPLFIHENFLSSMGNAASLHDCENMATAAEYISLGDMINVQIRYHQDWSLLSNLGIIGCVAPGMTAGGYIPYPKFPE